MVGPIVKPMQVTLALDGADFAKLMTLLFIDALKIAEPGLKPFSAKVFAFGTAGVATGCSTTGSFTGSGAGATTGGAGATTGGAGAVETGGVTGAAAGAIDEPVKVPVAELEFK